MALALGARPARAAEPVADHAALAALVFNFLKFVDWPSLRHQQVPAVVLCVRGEGPIVADLEQLSGKVVGPRPLRVRRLADDSATGCHAVLLAASTRPQAARMVARLAQPGVLLVGEGAGFVGEGVQLSVHVAENRVRFEANVAAIRRSGLVVSSKLLGLAQLVEGP